MLSEKTVDENSWVAKDATDHWRCWEILYCLGTQRKRQGFLIGATQAFLFV